MSVQKSTDSSSLAEVIDRILDKGIVIDAFARVSLLGIEILTVEARVVIASVDTWLRYAEAVGLLKDEADRITSNDKEGTPQFSL
ncbi:gas vesicle structural protein GvpA [Neobacillus sp. SCS-31]|uniref:gas vesicle structural protein GvpA n=1 Tax=Neobacillus oceani TaxID=3115292 RepID=UPI003905B20A